MRPTQEQKFGLLELRRFFFFLITSGGVANPGVCRLPGAGAGGEAAGVERVGGRRFGVEDPAAVRGGRQGRRHGERWVGWSRRSRSHPKSPSEGAAGVAGGGGRR